MSVRIPKGELWFCLGDKALVFAKYLELTKAEDEDAPAIRKIFESLREVEIDSPIFQNILQILKSKQITHTDPVTGTTTTEYVITQTEIDAVNARIDEENQPLSFE